MYTQACSTPPPMLPSPLDKRLTKDCDDAPRDTFLTSPQKSPAFSGSTYTSHEIVSEIPEFSSSLLHAVTLDVASSPPSSSPLQIFSSSPLASSQASEPPDDSQPDKSGYILNEVGPQAAPRSKRTTYFRSFRSNWKAFRMKQVAYALPP